MVVVFREAVYVANCVVINFIISDIIGKGSYYPPIFCSSGHSIPNQQKKIPTLLDFHEIRRRHGLYKETFSHQNLADSMVIDMHSRLLVWLPSPL